MLTMTHLPIWMISEQTCQPHLPKKVPSSLKWQWFHQKYSIPSESNGMGPKQWSWAPFQPWRCRWIPFIKKKTQIYWPFIYFITILQKIHFQYFTFYSPLTTFPTISILLKLPDIGWCSMAINNVFSTMQMVMVKSVNGSITISLTTFLIFSHAGQHSQMRKIWAKLYQHGGHFCLDSSSSDDETNKQKHLKVLFIFSIPKLG